VPNAATYICASVAPPREWHSSEENLPSDKRILRFGPKWPPFVAEEPDEIIEPAAQPPLFPIDPEYRAVLGDEAVGGPSVPFDECPFGGADQRRNSHRTLRRWKDLPELFGSLRQRAVTSQIFQSPRAPLSRSRLGTATAVEGGIKKSNPFGFADALKLLGQAKPAGILPDQPFAAAGKKPRHRCAKFSQGHAPASCSA